MCTTKLSHRYKERQIHTYTHTGLYMMIGQLVASVKRVNS